MRREDVVGVKRRYDTLGVGDGMSYDKGVVARGRDGALSARLFWRRGAVFFGGNRFELADNGVERGFCKRELAGNGVERGRYKLELAGNEV